MKTNSPEPIALILAPSSPVHRDDDTMTLSLHRGRATHLLVSAECGGLYTRSLSLSGVRIWANIYARARIRVGGAAATATMEYDCLSLTCHLHECAEHKGCHKGCGLRAFVTRANCCAVASICLSCGVAAFCLGMFGFMEYWAVLFLWRRFWYLNYWLHLIFVELRW